jgi:hypothetical protein
MLLYAHFFNPTDIFVRGGTTALSIVCFHTVAGMRMIDPLADLSLGCRVIFSAASKTCSEQGDHVWAPVREGGTRSHCKSRTALGAVMITAALLDLLLNAAYIHLLHNRFKNTSERVRQVLVEGCMLLCEATVFACTVVLTRLEESRDTELEGDNGTHNEMRSYAMLCSASTFLALVTTASLLVVPTSWWKYLEEEGLMAAAKSALRRVPVEFHIQRRAQVKPIATRASNITSINAARHGVEESSLKGRG